MHFSMGVRLSKSLTHNVSAAKQYILMVSMFSMAGLEGDSPWIRHWSACVFISEWTNMHLATG